MARYRKVSVQIWNDGHFSQFSDNGKLAFLFILSHPQMTSIGAMRHTIPGLAAELGWTEKAFREALQEAFRKPMVKVDEKNSLIVIPNFIKHNKPESANVVKSWVNLLELIPQCGLLVEYFQQVKALLIAFGDGYEQALPQAFDVPSPNPELELELELKHEQDEYQYNIPQNAGVNDPQTAARKSTAKRNGQLSSQQQAWFEEFWQRYPRKKDKGAALKAWGKLHVDEDTWGAISAALDWQVPEMQQKDISYVKYPATYLNAHGWESEPDKQTYAKSPGVFVDLTDEAMPF